MELSHNYANCVKRTRRECWGEAEKKKAFIILFLGAPTTHATVRKDYTLNITTNVVFELGILSHVIQVGR